MGIRTPDLLHAMKATPSPPPALTRRDQQKQRRRATPSDFEQRPPTLICYPDRYPAHARSALPQHRARRAPAASRGQGNRAWNHDGPATARDSPYIPRTRRGTARLAAALLCWRCQKRPTLHDEMSAPCACWDRVRGCPAVVDSDLCKRWLRAVPTL
jgi:hypothetical protein